MIVGVPREIKADEYRVAMLPVGAEELTVAGHTVLFEAGAGQGSGIVDALYASAGATIVESAGEIWSRADMIVKVKEPQPGASRGRASFSVFSDHSDRYGWRAGMRGLLSPCCSMITPAMPKGAALLPSVALWREAHTVPTSWRGVEAG